MKVALDTFKKLKEARGRLEQAQAAVAKLRQVVSVPCNSHPKSLL